MRYFLLTITFLLLLSCQKEDPKPHQGNTSREGIKTDSIHIWYFHSLNDSVLSKSQHFKYDELGRMTSLLVYTYSGYPVIYGGNKYNYQYNSSDSLTETDAYQWTFSKGWVKYASSQQTFDESNKLTEVLGLGVDINTGEVFNSSRILYSYNIEGIQDSMFNYEWDKKNGQWLLSNIAVDSADEAGRIVKRNRWYWSNDSMSFRPSQQTITSYNSNGKIIMQENDYWSKSGWLLESRQEYLLDGKGNPLTITGYGLYPFGFVVITNLHNYYYNESGQLYRVEHFASPSQYFGLTLTKIDDYSYYEDGGMKSHVIYGISGGDPYPYERWEYFNSSGAGK